MCEKACGFFLDCRAGRGGPQGLIADPDLLAAVEMQREAMDLERRARRLKDEAKAALPLDEHALFERTSIRELALLLLAFSALVAALTWPQVARLDSVSDHGDPLFSIWRIAWVSHQLPRNPLALFDANQFHPERLTLTYPGVHALLRELRASGCAARTAVISG